MAIIETILAGIGLALDMAWETWWALVLGFTITGAVEEFTTEEGMTKYLGDDGWREAGLGTAFGAATSSCSFSAVATAKTLYKKGASPVSSLAAFQFAATDLVVELGLVMWILLGWQFVAADFFGGLVAVAVLVVIFRRVPQSWWDEAYEHVLALEETTCALCGMTAEPADDDTIETTHDDESVYFCCSGCKSAWENKNDATLAKDDTEMLSTEGWKRVSANAVREWDMLWEDIALGFLIAGLIGAFVPREWWATLFGTGDGFTFVLTSALIAVVIGVAIPVLYLAHTRFFKPVGDRFVESGLPEIVAKYRRFLHWMLQRDYSVKRPFLRNTFALGAFTGGVVLAILGSVIGSVAGQTAGMILLVPGGILAVLGIIGILVHTLESLYLGGFRSVRGGLIFGAIMLAILGLMYLGPREVEVATIVELMLLPAVIVVAGLAGMIFNRKGRERLLLTDNRARLLNGSLGAFIAILAMFAVAPTGVEFFPDTDPQQIQIKLNAALGTNVEASNRIAMTAQDRVDALLEEEPESEANIKNLLVNVGVGGDMMFGGGSQRSENSNITLNLVDYEDREESSSETMARLRQQMQGIPGTEIEFTKDEMGPPTGEPINIEISGDDFSQIVDIAAEVKQRLVRAAESGSIPGLVDVADDLNTGRPELQVNIDRERAARYGLNTSQIANTIRSAINGIEASKFRKLKCIDSCPLNIQPS